MSISLEQAQTLALQGLAFLAKDEDHLGGFLASSGMGPLDLRQKMNEPEVLGGVLDYILAHDHTLLHFCAEVGISPETLMEARRVLPGGFEIYG